MYTSRLRRPDAGASSYLLQRTIAQQVLQKPQRTQNTTTEAAKGGGDRTRLITSSVLTRSTDSHAPPQLAICSPALIKVDLTQDNWGLSVQSHRTVGTHAHTSGAPLPY
jgi:hypothetical protein